MTKERVVEIAVQAAEAHADGRRDTTIAGHEFRVGPVYGADGKAKGYCARLVRQVHEAALGLGEYEWAFRAANAREMEANLERAGLQVDKPEPGDIVCFNKNGGTYGHIGIWLGDGKIAENTSAGNRGKPREPGTKITPLSATLKKRVSGYYAAMPAAKDKPRTVLMIEHGTGKVVGSFKLVPNGNHIEDQGKVYVEP